MIICPSLILTVFIALALNSQLFAYGRQIREKEIAVVTGANKGIGFQICKKLGAAGIRVIAACRNESLGLKAVAKLKGLGYDVEYRNVDISDEQSIARFSLVIAQSYAHLDILVNNAAIAYRNDTKTYLEQATDIMKTNLFGTIRLTETLLPLLRKAAAPRIVNVSSQAGKLRILKSKELMERFVNCPNVEALEGLINEYLKAVQDHSHTEKGWPHEKYGLSKLALNTLTRILAKREAEAHPGKNFFINACSPGFCRTDINFNKGKRSAEHGARTPAMLALMSAVGPVAPTGKFFFDEVEIDW